VAQRSGGQGRGNPSAHRDTGRVRRDCLGSRRTCQGRNSRPRQSAGPSGSASQVLAWVAAGLAGTTPPSGSLGGVVGPNSLEGFLCISTPSVVVRTCSTKSRPARQRHDGHREPASPSGICRPHGLGDWHGASGLATGIYSHMIAEIRASPMPTIARPDMHTQALRQSHGA
jgi:hypothetical protein